MPREAAETPLMKQYNAFKAKYPEALLLFRIGDFYETFGQDAVIASQVLGIVLTKRANGAAAEIELAGFPHHALDTYLPQLVRSGYRVAICEQLEDPKLAKGIVKRGVTEVVTPGVALSDRLLDHRSNNYLASIHFSLAAPNRLGLAFVEVSTGDFFCTSGDIDTAEKLLFSLAPSEVLVARRDLSRFKAQFGDDFYASRLEDWVFDFTTGHQLLCRHFNTTSLKGFGVEDHPDGITAAGVLIHYLHSNEYRNLQHLQRLYLLDSGEYLTVDRFTLRNLELLQPLHPDGRALVEVLDQTRTPMGARLLRRHIALPLRDRAAIAERHDRIAVLIDHPARLAELQPLLRAVGDPERWLARLSTRRITPRECASLRASLQAASRLRDLVETWQAPAYLSWLASWQSVEPAFDLLMRTLADDCPANVQQGGFIRVGVSARLDEVRCLRDSGEAILEDIREREAQRTGISSLKIRFNRVFGYYIEISHANRSKVPDDYIRKQTLANAERYVTPELKELEAKILTAEADQQVLELHLYEQLLDALQVHLPALQHDARLLAEIDVIQSWATLARTRNYVRPEILESTELQIHQGRHPVIESLLPPDQPYIPTDVSLDTVEQQILIITGPNMAGKSAVLRMTGLVVLMAQMGGWVPARSARIGWVDRLFTRVGASDNQAQGESTFMVEMNESARILNNATPRSLILLDEVGRGTSTFDGVSIAWAMVEYLHEEAAHAARTLFATHYHELAALADQYPRIRNYHVAVREAEGKILFLRQLLPGSSAHSFGIQVAEMAGMPRRVVERARELLPWLEEQFAGERNAPRPFVVPTRSDALPQVQLKLFHLEDETAQRVRLWLNRIDLERLTPMDAMIKLIELKKMLDES